MVGTVIAKVKGSSAGDDYTMPASDGSSGEFLKTDGSGNLSFASAAAGFTAVTFYTDTSGATWSKSTNNPTKIVVEVIGAGGGSGSGAGSGGSSASGSYAIAFIDVSTVTTATVTVGAGGAGGIAGGASGGTGGTSKFTYATGTGSFTEIECPGGGGGGNSDHTASTGTAMPTGPTNGLYVKGGGGGGAGNSGKVPHGYGTSQSGSYTSSTAGGYGYAVCTSGSASPGLVGGQGLVVVWEYK